MTHRNSFATWICVTLLLLVTAARASASDHDKPKQAPPPKAPAARPAPANHSGPPAGYRSNGGRPTTGAPLGRPSGNTNVGRPSGSPNPGRPNSSMGAGRPNPSTGRPNPSIRTGGNGRPGSLGRPDARNPGMRGNAGTGVAGKNSPSMAGTTGGRGPRGGVNDSKRPGTHEPWDKGGNAPSMRRDPVRHISEVNGRSVARDDRGRVREIHGRDSHGHDMEIHRDLSGRARFETRRPGGYRVVGYGHGRGFAERRYITHGGRIYYQRTYIYGGRRYAVAYRYYPYRGVYYYGYAPAYYYRPAFYGWAYAPWPGPVVYRWGWYGDPWYGYYGPYFTPYPAYSTASLWLTDYLLAENLRAAYEANVAAQANANAAAAAQNASPQNGSQVTLSPEVKQMIADEVKRQLDAERASAVQSGQAGASAQAANAPAEEMPAALDPNQRIFIVASNLDLVGDSGECTVTAGDVLMRMGNQPDQNNKVPVTVVSSKQGDCPTSTNSDVETTDLQEMHNQFRQQLDAGLKTLAENQGTNGLPKAPDTSTVNGEVPPPQPDATAGSDLENQQKDAQQAEQDTQAGARSTSGDQGGR